jgi:hypothetical protein
MAFGGEDRQYDRRVDVPAVAKKSSAKVDKTKPTPLTPAQEKLKTFTETQNLEAQARIASRGFTQGEQNPKFIYPATRDKTKARDTVGGTTINRGYVRRLTEFYARQSTGTDAASTLGNLKCNFQFNPDSITRAIQSDTSMQFFFNQDPAQLTQPVPGKAGYAFDLLFNREAEVNSGQYLMGGKLLKGKRADEGTNNSSFEQTSSRFLSAEKYDPAWVTEIGVLADIMVLDDILGVGLAKDVAKAIADNALSLAAEEQESVDPADATSTVKETVYDPSRMTAFTSNLGNKAFLVPQPIRVVFSNWMMVEGFITSSQVTFNKFTRGFIPTQCSVAVQMQALYIGFVQQKTFLTDMPIVPTSEIDGVEGNSDLALPGTAERQLQDTTVAGLANFIKSATWVKGSFNDLAVSTFLSKGEQKVKNINFTIIVSDKGSAFFKSIGSAKDPGGGIAFTFSGTLKIAWHSYVNNASNSRTINGGNATSASTLTYTTGAPPDTGANIYSQYGTVSKPLVISIDHHPIKYKVDVDRGISKIEDVMVYGKNPTYRWGSEGSDAKWTWELGSELTPRPFNQDKFNVELEITTYCTRSTLGEVALPQVITLKSTGINYNQVMGLTKLTVGTK